ncbi:MAG: DMT family transporter [Ferruginibacter sp.]|nr:DMT family transporter [Ferruginibacter sp.]
MSKNLINWILFIVLSLIWGSSFILMKLGLQQLSSYQVAALRIVSSGAILLPITVKYIRRIPAKKLLLVFLSGTLGSLLPAFLFCLAEEKIDSALAGTLNALTPVFVIITGVIFFNAKIASNKIIGILIALTGCILLLFSKSLLQTNPHFSSLLLVILATILYGFNVNMVSKNLLQIPSLQIAAVALSLNALPALMVLILTGYFSMPLYSSAILTATGASILLGLMGTAIATIIFYVLVKRAGIIFATMVTYGIPFVAIAWGIFYGEIFGWRQFFCLIIILAGVYYTHKK